MASLDEMEGDLIEAAGGLIVLFVVLLVLGLIAAWKSISWPQALYPDSLWSGLASSTDTILNNSPLAGGPTQKSLDSFFATVWIWINENLPRSTATAGTGDASTIDAGGTNVSDYTPQGAAGS